MAANIAQSKANSAVIYWPTQLAANVVKVRFPFLFFAFAHFVCAFSLWQCAMKSSIKSDWRKTLSLSGKLCYKVFSVVNGKYVAIRSVANVALNLLHLQWHFGATCPDWFISQISLEYFTSSASFVPVSLRGVYVMQTH